LNRTFAPRGLVGRSRNRRLFPLATSLAAAVLIAGCGTTAPLMTESSGGSNNGLAQSGQSVQVGPGQSSTNQALNPSSPQIGQPSAGPGATTLGLSSSSNTSLSTLSSGGAVGGCNMPTTGPGWDAKHVYLGSSLETDSAKVGSQLNFSAFDFGDQKAIADAAFNALNATGGLCGRTVVPVYYDVSSVNDTNQEAQAACTKWTQDQRVIETALVPNINIPNAYACLSKAHIPIVTETGSPSLLKDLAPYSPYVMLQNASEWDRFATFFVDQLSTMGYFKPWDTVNGAPGTAPVKVAIVTGNDPIEGNAYKRLQQVLQQHHFEVTDFFTYTDPTQLGSDIVKMRQDGVTHVFLDRLAGLFYESQADSQNYHARYALNSNNFIQPFLVNGQAPSQLRGAMGVGWIPSLDVAQAQDPGTNAAYAQCMQIMQKAGVDVSKRNYKFTATASCDGVLLTKRAVEAAGSFEPAKFIPGMLAGAANMHWASQAGATGHPNDPELLSGARDVVFDASCSCTRYTSGVLQIP
jgi:hypothetical protein